MVFVNDLLDSQDDRGHLPGVGGHTDLSVDEGVGVPGVVLAGGVGGGQGASECDKESLHDASLRILLVDGGSVPMALYSWYIVYCFQTVPH